MNFNRIITHILNAFHILLIIITGYIASLNVEKAILIAKVTNVSHSYYRDIRERTFADGITGLSVRIAIKRGRRSAAATFSKVEASANENPSSLKTNAATRSIANQRRHRSWRGPRRLLSTHNAYNTGCWLTHER
jgi:hypothetical protein